MHAPSRSEASFLGALTADAASLGLHWIYDFDHLAKLAESKPEFREPDPKAYEGVFSFFAHGQRQAGDLSHYGEVLLLAAETLAEDARLAEGGPRLKPRAYQARYREHFGPGGRFVGYVDSPMRLTLENLARYDAEAAEVGLRTSGGLKPEIARVVVQKVVPYTRFLSGAELVLPVTRAIQVTYSEPEVLAAALEIARTIDAHKPMASGAIDEQAPAVATLAALGLQLGSEDELRATVEPAVRVTNNADFAVACARFSWDLLRGLQRGEALEAAFRAAIDRCEGPARDAAMKGWNTRLVSLKGVSAEIGRTCYLKEALPLAVCLLKNTTNFTDAVRANIRAGGDSCGRSMMLGAWAGALYGLGGAQGVPLSWLLRLRAGARVGLALQHREG
jgi:hypothetical protein